MQEHLKRQDGVGKVDVNLESGHVAIYPKPDAKIDPATILKAVYDSGVSPAEMTMTADGKIVKGPANGWLFKISGDQVFEVAPNTVSEEVWKAAESGAPITLRGQLYKKPKDRSKQKTIGSLRFEILEVVKKR